MSIQPLHKNCTQLHRRGLARLKLSGRVEALSATNLYRTAFQVLKRLPYRVLGLVQLAQ